MESNYYPLSNELQRRIQGLVGEIVAVDYVLKNIKDKASFGDEILIITNRCNNIKPKGNYLNQLTLVKCSPVYESPHDFLRHSIVDNFQQIGCEGIDFTNADIEAKNLFNKYMSKNKEQILSELEQIYTKEREKYAKEIEELERKRKERKKEVLMAITKGIKL